MTTLTVAEISERADEKTDPYLPLFENMATQTVAEMSESADEKTDLYLSLFENMTTTDCGRDVSQRGLCA